MTTWADLQDALLYDVPGCSYPLGAAALRNGAREFCRKSLAWRQTLEPVALVAGAQMQVFTMDPALEVIKVIGASLDGRELDVLLPHQVGHGTSGVAVLNPTQFRIYPAPGAGQSIEFTVALMPSHAALGILDWVASTYSDALEQAARARLFGTANQPFSNPEAALVAEAKLKDEINRAITRTAKAYSSAPVRTRPSFF